MSATIGRNDLCPCGSGTEYQQCLCRNSVGPHIVSYFAYHEAGHALLEMLFYRNLNYVSIAATFCDKETGIVSGMISMGIAHDLKHLSLKRKVIHDLQQMAIILAGKAAGDCFCSCGWHTDIDAHDREDLNKYRPKPALVSILREAVSALIRRHRPQLDAIANALIQHETLSGDQVFDAMLVSGWNPETDSDPEQFYNEALGTTADGAAA